MWIEFHDGARDHPKILKLARDLEISEVTALGHMVSLWAWTLRMAPDGNLSSFDYADIEIGAKWGGDPGRFVQACKSRRLLDETRSGYVVHDWDHYSGSLKVAERKRRERARKKPDKSQDGHATVGGPSRDVTQNERPKERKTERQKGDPPPFRKKANKEKKTTLVETIYAETYRKATNCPWEHGDDFQDEFVSLQEWCEKKAAIDKAPPEPVVRRLIYRFFGNPYAKETDFNVGLLAGAPGRFYNHQKRSSEGSSEPREKTHVTAMARIGLENEIKEAQADMQFCSEQGDKEGAAEAAKRLRALKAKLNGNS